MEWAQWLPTYEAILADFAWEPGPDEASAKLLQGLMEGRPDGWPTTMGLLGVEEVVVVGAGPSLEQLTQWPDQWRGAPVVCADGATTWLRHLGVVPEVVVTDLDGPWEDLLWAARQGSRLVVHAHGHNQAALEQLVPQLGTRVAGSCQCNPAGLAPLGNLGGFTDGDRAVLLCEAAGARQVRLVGFDLDGPPGRLSHRFDPATKAKKLRWASNILNDVRSRGRTRLLE